jgi:hydroxyacylglutathione hydrolase
VADALAKHRRLRRIVAQREGGTMRTDIWRLPMVGANCYLIRQEGIMLIDAAPPRRISRLARKLASLSIKPTDISLIVVTHAHYDHVGSLHDLHGLTGAKVAVNRHEKGWVERASHPRPPAFGLWGKTLSLFGGWTASLAGHYPGTSVDIALDDADFPLQPFGISGRIIYTPGHTPGSSTVLLDTGDAFVGDLAMNGFPLRLGPGMPCFGDSTEAVRRSWKLILDQGAKTIYPGHGQPFKADALRKAPHE